MIRRTITTLTLAVVTTIGVATAAPALAAPPSDPITTIDVPLVDPCIVSCVSFEWDLGSLLDPAPAPAPAPAPSEPADPGIVVDVPGIVVDPDILIVDVPLDAIVDLTPPAEDPTPTGDEDIERIAPIGPDELRSPGDTETPATPPTVTETAPSVASEMAPAPSEEPHVDTTDAFATTPETPTTTVTVPEPAATTFEATGDAGSTVTSDAATTDDATTDIALDTPVSAPADGGGFNAGLAVLMGIATVVALAGTAAGAYRFGRQRA